VSALSLDWLLPILFDFLFPSRETSVGSADNAGDNAACFLEKASGLPTTANREGLGRGCNRGSVALTTVTAGASLGETTEKTTAAGG
jgi:hypothetical protein